MLVAKSFLITGGTIHRADHTGQVVPHKEIAEKVDKAINSFLENMDGKLVDLKPNVQIGTSQDTAFITIIVEVDGRKKIEPTTTTVKK